MAVALDKVVDVLVGTLELCKVIAALVESVLNVV